MAAAATTTNEAVDPLENGNGGVETAAATAAEAILLWASNTPAHGRHSTA